jgi:hypothetical protein
MDIDPTIVTAAKQLSDEIERSAQPVEASPAAADAIEIAFRERAASLKRRPNAQQTNQRVGEELHNSAVPLRPATQAVAPVTRPSSDQLSQQT